MSLRGVGDMCANNRVTALRFAAARSSTQSVGRRVGGCCCSVASHVSGAQASVGMEHTTVGLPEGDAVADALVAIAGR